MRARNWIKTCALTVLLLSSLTACGGGGDFNSNPNPNPSPMPFRVETFLSGLSFPVTMAFAPDGRLFYNELGSGGTARVRVVQGGQLLATPFATRG